MRTAIVVIVLTGALLGCQKASRWDGSNPVHCLTVFGLGSAGAAARPDAALANDLNARMMRIVEANGGVEWLKEVTPESQRLAAEIEAANDGAAVRQLFDDCAARHPPDR